MRRILRNDDSGLGPRFWIVVAVIAIVGIILSLVIVAFFGPPKALSTTVIITDAAGRTYVVYQDSGSPSPPAGSIATIGGVPIKQIAWYTNFKATSPNYQQYTVIAGSLWGAGMFAGSQPTVQALLSGTSTQCPSFVTIQAPTTFGTLQVGTQYNLGSLTSGGIGTPPVLAATDYTILNVWSLGTCAPSGTYWLLFMITINIQAVGLGNTLPTASYSERVYTQVTIGAGTITIIGTSTAVGTVISPGFQLGVD